MEVDFKKLRRAGIEPARVFARRDFDPDDNRPVLHYSWGDREFYSPHFPTWMFEAGDDTRVIEKAILRYGLEEAPVTGKWYDGYAEFLFDPKAGERVPLGPPVYKQMNNGSIVPFHHIGKWNVYIAATPMMYADRRWGGNVTLRKGGRFVRLIVDGRVVGVIRTHDGKYLADPQED